MTLRELMQRLTAFLASDSSAEVYVDGITPRKITGVKHKHIDGRLSILVEQEWPEVLDTTPEKPLNTAAAAPPAAPPAEPPPVLEVQPSDQGEAEKPGRSWRRPKP
jgi:hypothetical protein